MSPARPARRGGERVVWQHIAAGSASSAGVLLGGYLVQVSFEFYLIHYRSVFMRILLTFLYSLPEHR